MGRCFENTNFTQLGFIDNLESKGEDINKNQLNTPLGVQNWDNWSAGYRLSLMCAFMFGENMNTENTEKANSRRSKVSLKKVSCSMSRKCYLISKRLSNEAILVLYYFKKWSGK